VVMVRSLILDKKHFAEFKSSGGYCGKVVGVGSEGHELATTGLDRARLPAWTSVGRFLRSMTALEKLMNEITNIWPRKKLRNESRKLGNTVSELVFRQKNAKQAHPPS